MRGPTAFRRPRWRSHSDTAVGRRGPARRSGRHDTHPMQRRGAKSFVDDLVLSRGVVLSRAAASLRSIETKPFDWQICPLWTDTSTWKALALSLRSRARHELSRCPPPATSLPGDGARRAGTGRAFLFRQSSISGLWPSGSPRERSALKSVFRGKSGRRGPSAVADLAVLASAGLVKKL